MFENSQDAILIEQVDFARDHFRGVAAVMACQDVG